MSRAAPNYHICQECRRDPLLFSPGTPMEIIESFGGKEQYLHAIKELEEHLYRAA